ncbi:nickel/cobalt transporter [Rhodoplanes serenus]|uniref:nickel/cobalt transporter n=1 Tax=Rhodoplanes serenus TaxID=200615 RepID=UPI000DAEEA3A|nr:nickel/cobalt transporter [Rhodoplanes serenus]RAI31744.1 nickel transporter [Rhodoplanes serenus]
MLVSGAAPAGRRAGPVAAGLAVAALVAVALVIVAGPDAALAQTTPFGVPRPPAPAPTESGLIGWILAEQARFYRALSGLVRAAKQDGSAVWSLLGVSFAYGVFHAAGPGHGKAVISSYMIANDETWRRGVVLSFASAFLQAAVAVAVVGVAAALLGATARSMNTAVRWIEIVSYALIALVGARLVWLKGRGFWRALRDWQTSRRPAAAAPAAVPTLAPAAHPHPAGCGCGDHGHPPQHQHAAPDHPAPAATAPMATATLTLARPDAVVRSEAHSHTAHSHTAHSHAPHDHVHGPGCEHDGCGHAHGPAPQDLAGPGGWSRGLAAIVAVGLRPCSGAILVLVFALAQGLFWAGIGATFAMGLGTAITVTAIATVAVGAKAMATRLAQHRPGPGALALRGLEVLAAVAVLAFGVALLAGYMVSERMI